LAVKRAIAAAPPCIDTRLAGADNSTLHHWASSMFDIGVMLNNLERDRHRAWSVAGEIGFRIVHTSALPEAWLLPHREQQSQLLLEYVAAARASGLSIHSMFIGFDGQSYADPASAARTVGLAVTHLQVHRLQVALAYCPLARDLNASALAMHAGQMTLRRDPDYAALLEAVGRLADRCADYGLSLHLETGQESAAALRDFLIDVGRPNVGINFDPANFVLYATGDPLAALEILKDAVGGVHCKDALPPAAPGQMGTDVPLGQGRVDFRKLLPRLRDLGYRGPLIIEREHGSTVRQDIEQGRAYLQRLVNEMPDGSL
jgi:sugar phosphate isomerase/epimerase